MTASFSCNNTAYLTRRQASHLTRLMEELTRRGWLARMFAINDVPVLQVANPRAPGQLHDLVRCHRDGEGRWWFRWVAYALAIAPADDLSEAVETVMRVLRAAGE